MKVIILSNVYNTDTQQLWRLQIDDRLAEFCTWSDGRTWLNYYQEDGSKSKYTEYNHLREYYMPLDKKNPARTIDKFYKIMMLQ